MQEEGNDDGEVEEQAQEEEEEEEEVVVVERWRARRRSGGGRTMWRARGQIAGNGTECRPKGTHRVPTSKSGAFEGVPEAQAVAPPRSVRPRGLRPEYEPNRSPPPGLCLTTERQTRGGQQRTVSRTNEGTCCARGFDP